MRKTLIQCCIALLLAPVLTLSLIGTVALAAAGNTGAASSGSPDISDSSPDASNSNPDTSNSSPDTSDSSPSEEFTIKADDYQNGIWEVNLNGTFTAYDKTGEKLSKVIWVSSNEDVATINNDGLVVPHAAGTATISAYYWTDDGKRIDSKNTETITVSGLVAEPVTVEENNTVTMSVTALGAARNSQISYTVSSGNYFISISGDKLSGLHIGEGKVMANAGTYRAEITVTVIADSSTTIRLNRTLKNGDILPFTDSYLSSQLNSQLKGQVSYITGMLVPTNQGTLYYRYISESEPGAGVGQVDTYYRRPGAGQRALSDITFVPKPDYPGGEVSITYTAFTADGRSYSCRIYLTLQGSSGNDSQGSGISLKTPYNTAVKLDGAEFGTVCREQLGVQLDYVVFSQPPERQGALYTNYSVSSGYGSVVDVHRQYSRKEVDDVWFVPAPGYSGTVTVYYTGFGTNGKSYSGQVVIEVETENLVAIGGLGYSTTPGSAVRFDDEDFNNYCQDILDSDQTLNFIRFEYLPSESDGVLYYDYTSSTNTGSRASSGTNYYYGTRAPRIDRLVFVPAESASGTLKLPFTGWTTQGAYFSGNVEINIRGGVASGDIYYSCAPGRSVSFRSNDFSRLSSTLTGRTIDYIRFQSLPRTSEGSLYYNSARISSTGTRYTNSNLSRLSFRASNSFSGAVDIPFEGRSTGGVTFNGVITIGSNGAGSSGIGWGNIRYITDSRTAAVFNRDDFDDLSQWETDRNVSSVRFDLPSSNQGSLYRNYYSSSSMGTRITSTSSIAASSLNRIAFVPASGYTGTVYINFTATANSNGGTFTGTVEIEVQPPPADATARYSTRTEAVRFYVNDFARSGYTLKSIQFTSLPPSSTGHLYYQYTSPIRYGQQVNTAINYQTSGSNLISDLTFVPRAGYSGTVTIPYTGTNSSGSTFTGEVIITVSPSSGSSYFNDMSGYSDAQRAAVDFLYNQNVTRGISTGQYGPENSIRRGDFALMLYQAFEISSTSYSGAFVDVASDAYYADAVNALHARGIVSGIGNGYYAPDSTLTRQDAICMVQRAMNSIGWNASDGYASALTGYSDSASVSGYAQGAMAMAIQRGYLPVTGGWLNPTQPLTRVDMAEVLHRVLTY